MDLKQIINNSLDHEVAKVEMMGESLEQSIDFYPYPHSLFYGSTTGMFGAVMVS